MPNWVQNNIKFSGDTAEIKKMLEAIKNDEISFGSIDFNKIIPMQESLNIECGSITNKGIWYFIKRKKKTKKYITKKNV